MSAIITAIILMLPSYILAVACVIMIKSIYGRIGYKYPIILATVCIIPTIFIVWMNWGELIRIM